MEKERCFRVADYITHQGIGGKKFIVDELISKTLTFAEVWGKAKMGNYACLNFINRRVDTTPDFPHKVYYGKVGNLGYVVAEDELEEWLD